ncbi:flagellar hook-associated protein 3 [Methylovorus sp. MM2]|uniref:flagellar hook-associated protein FlgL n=1 Tax=Methylovorus sp. MM2 TaxID=1848038 RepID=UPI0007E1E9C1|nr:flagellar hook-associated protein FlgL [Methylovorus sp. MM2]OAM51269.1 flagellar hook-associated protein 3 [Methylovorus sp. MM2]
MRISTNTIYDSGIARISNIQADQVKLQEQIATMKRINKPSDDPVGSARVVELTQAQSINSQYKDNRSNATAQLNTVEGALSSISDVILSVQSNIVGAGNAVLSNQQRGDLATQIQSSLSQLVALANSKDASSNYLFAGFNIKTAPYVETATGATYTGDDGTHLVQVDSSRQIAINETGSSIFQANGNDIFASLKSLVTLLQTPVVTDADRDALSTGLGTLNASVAGSLDNVVTARASVGTKLQELEALDTAGSEKDIQYQATLSNIQDLDYTKALSDLTKQKTVLDAAMQSFTMTTGLSLFSML